MTTARTDPAATGPARANRTPAPGRADVVICTYTEQRWDLLERAVESALTQTEPPRAVVVVTDHNRDLYERCRARWQAGPAHPVPVVVVENRFAGRLGSARNTGLLQCTAEVVAFLDDDAAAEPDWLATLLADYADPGVVAVGGAPVPDYGAARPRWFPPSFDWVFGCRYTGLPTTPAPARHLIGAAMSVRRDAILAEGGFHADDHDDMDLSHRIAHTHGAASVRYDPRAVVRHWVAPQRLTWHYFWRRCLFVNRGKVGAFADLGDAGNLGAEARFAARTLLALVPAVVAGLGGRRDRLVQALVAVAGVALAGAGHLAGRAELALGRRVASPTTGLTAADLAAAVTTPPAGETTAAPGARPPGTPSTPGTDGGGA